jgi:hypothetical protein
MKLIDDIERTINIQLYRNAINELIEYFHSHDCVLSIGQIGELSEPGISDIDCIIVVRERKLKQIYRSFLSWRRLDENKKYLFFHPPLFITEKMCTHLPYLHTLHSLRWLYKKSGIPHNLHIDYKQYLSLIWASYIFSISLNMLYSTAPQSLRKVLLVLKNLHISIDALRVRSDKSERCVKKSELIRKKVKLNQGGLSTISNEIENETSESIQQLLEILHQYNLPYNHSGTTITNKRSIQIKKKISLTHSPDASISPDTTRHIIAFINEAVIDHLLTPWYNGKLTHNQYQVYRYHLLNMYRLCRIEHVPFNYVTPFDVPVHKGRVYLTLRELVLRTYRHIPGF